MEPSSKRHTAALVVMIAGLILTPPVSVSAESKILRGDVRILVQDEAGTRVAAAAVYIFDGQHIRCLQTGNNGAIDLVLAQGQYDVSSSMSKPVTNAVDRFASSEAHIRVIPEDRVSIILTLRPVNDPVTSLTLSTLTKIGVADEVAKLLN